VTFVSELADPCETYKQRKARWFTSRRQARWP
jgi:hypothetical protein